MNIITGYLAATAGTVKINGADVALEPEKAKQCVGYLPELPPLYMDMTVKEYLDFAAELKKIEKGKRAKQVAEAMEMTGITDVSGRLIRNLSKGYKQRVGFAQAVLGKPEIIILDEPTVGLDPKQIIEIRDLIKKLGESHTVILSSHILTEISAVCDHVFIISTGNQQISLLVKAEAEAAEGALLALAGVERCELSEQREEGTAALLISAKKDCDIREDIFHTCAEAQLPILEMKTAEKSLEDVFLELTAKGGMGA